MDNIYPHDVLKTVGAALQKLKNESTKFDFKYEVSPYNNCFVIYFVPTGMKDLFSIYFDNAKNQLRVVIMSTYLSILKSFSLDISDEETLKNAIKKVFDTIENKYDFRKNVVKGVDSKLAALNIEIRRSRNKLKYMEAQLFPNGLPKSLPSGKSTQP